MSKDETPTLTEAVGRQPVVQHEDSPAMQGISAAEIAELQTEISAGCFELVDRLMHNAFREMEATLFDDVVNRLKSQLPDMIDEILTARLDQDAEGNEGQ